MGANKFWKKYVTDEDVKVNNNIDIGRCDFWIETYFKQINGNFHVEAYGKVLFKESKRQIKRWIENPTHS